MVRLAAFAGRTGAVTDDARLRAESAELARLLEELREMVVPAAWLRVEQIVRRIVALYAAGLARLIDHARTAGARGPDLDDLLVEDPLVASLLVLHGLHPLPTEERIRRVLESLRSQLGLAEGALVNVELDEAGILRLRASTGLGGGAMSSRVAEGIVRRAIEAAAPEVSAIEIANASTARDPSLVQIRVRREAP